MSVVRRLDLIVLAAALPVFLLAGWPLLGWAAGAVAWIAQSLIRAWANGKATATREPGKVAGIVTASMIGRGWLVAITIFAAGMVDNDAGLAAAILFLVVFTVSFASSMFLRPFQQPPTEQPS